jgi:hypothetical protein
LQGSGPELRRRFFPVFSFAALVLPSTPPRFHKVDRHDLRGHRGGSSTCGNQQWPQISQTQTFIVFQPMASNYSVLTSGQNVLFISGGPRL